MTADKLLKFLVEPARWLIVAGIAYTLAVTIWMFFATPVSQPAVATSANIADRSAKRAPANVNWILQKNLFGELGAAPAEAPVSTEEAVQTRLPLELQSVFVAEEEEYSAAIVAERGKPGKLFHVGDKLPGNATLNRVEHDRIILLRAGVREALPFPKAKTQFQAAPVEEALPDESLTYDDHDDYDAYDTYDDEPYGDEEDAALYDDAASEDLDYDLQESFEEDAAGTLEDLGIEAQDGGGYRIGDMSKAPFLRQTGLQPGDVILSVNGRPVGDIDQDQLEVDNIVAQGTARVEIQRGSRRFFITAPIPSGQ